MTKKMRIDGRHARRPKPSSLVAALSMCDGGGFRLRIDDEANPDFWIEVSFQDLDLKTASALYFGAELVTTDPTVESIANLQRRRDGFNDD